MCHFWYTKLYWNGFSFGHFRFIQSISFHTRSKLEFIHATSTLHSLEIDGVAKQTIQTTICTRELVNRQGYFDSHNVASSFAQNFCVCSCVAQLPILRIMCFTVTFHINHVHNIPVKYTETHRLVLQASASVFICLNPSRDIIWYCLQPLTRSGLVLLILLLLLLSLSSSSSNFSLLSFGWEIFTYPGM